VLAARFESFRDPFIILAGWEGRSRFPVCFSSRSQVSIDQHLRSGRTDHPFGLVSQRYSDRAVRESSPGTRLRRTARRARGCRNWIGPGAGARNSIGIMLVTRIIIRPHKSAEIKEAEEAGELEPATA